MSSYAVLGGTGQVGGSILKLLLESSDKTIHVYVRSKEKLYSTQPQLRETSKAQIFEGPLDDVDLLTECISGTKAVFMAVAASDNIPGCTIAQDQAQNVVAALQQLRKEKKDAPLPVLIVLSSASLNRELCEDIPKIAFSILKMGASYIYEDLQKAEDFLRSHEWVRQVYIKPGGLVHDQPRGHVLSTERQETFLSFLDLAAGMVEVADEESHRWDFKNVSVLPKTPGTRAEPWVPIFLVKGLLYHFLPWAYPYLSNWLPA